MSWEKGRTQKGSWVEMGQIGQGYGTIATGSRFILMGKMMHKEIQMILNSESVLTSIQTCWEFRFRWYLCCVFVDPKKMQINTGSRSTKQKGGVYFQYI